MVLPQFWLPRRGSTSSNTGGVGFVLFLLLFLCCIVSFGDHWRFSVGYFPLWCWCIFAATIYRCGARNFHRCNLPDHIPSSLGSSYSFLRLIFPRSSLSTTGSLCFHFSFWEFFLAQKSSLDRAPRRGEGRVICLDSGWTTLLDAMVSLTFTSFDNYAFSMLWCCTCFASSDDFISVHNDVQVWVRLATFRILCSVPSADI